VKPLSRRTWHNHTGNQSCQPLGIWRPTSVEQVARIVADAERREVTVRAVGSGHSWSDVALTGGYLIETHGLAGLQELLPHDRVRVAAGTRVRELNAALDEHRLGLSNMGGYDAQTVAGVLSTATHGSGVGIGPIADAVRSLDVVAGAGRLVRIRRASDPAGSSSAAAPAGWETIADDTVFDAAVVGMGCMGVIVAVELQVQPRYCLEERRELTTWEEVRAELADGRVLRSNRHYEVYVNPYRRKGRHRAIRCTRNPVPCDDRHDERNRLTELLSTLPLTGKLGNLVLDTVPAAAPAMLDGILARIADPSFRNVSHRVLNIGAANLLPAYSAEIGVPLDGRHLDAVECVIEVAERQRSAGNVFATAPIALRFVAASPALMAPMHERPTMMIELILATDTEGGFELLAAYEDALYALSGRPHWGQVNSLTPELVEQMYPRFDAWQEVRRRLDPADTFDSPFAKRVGITDRTWVA
jgi:hypothetical protein